MAAQPPAPPSSSALHVEDLENFVLMLDQSVDKDTGAMKFELDENRFITKDGKEYGSFDNSKGTYFESGEVDEDADFMGKLGSFFGGGNKK